MRTRPRTIVLLAAIAIVLLAAAKALAATGPAPAESTESPTVTVAPVTTTAVPDPGSRPFVATRATGPARYSLLLIGCESDRPTLPCVIWDEGEWRVVYGWAPHYSYRPVGECSELARAVPCVDPRPVGERYRVRAQRVDLG